jgi:FkbH-like protein
MNEKSTRWSGHQSAASKMASSMSANQFAENADARIDAIGNDVKMVIWDLDETFWSGTLAEGGIRFIDANATVVKELAARGIISSIASKNDYHAAKQILSQAGIWEYFVFPSISYDPKGKRVAEIIQNASLRPDNVLLIDDNTLNLEEARFFNNGLMVVRPMELLPDLLDHPKLAGKPDPELRRLKQYQLLQRKFIDRQSTSLSNEDFLRASGIQIRFDYDVEANFARIVDLINRSNQLNYTRRRLHTREDIEAFRLSLNQFGVSAACISCSDRYGDYGIIGFYALKLTAKNKSLLHFLFSCRIMNMGIEEFVFGHLGRPEIDVVPNVAYGLDCYDIVDWIKISDHHNTLGRDDRKLLLVGGCELLQLSSFCSSNRVEFVNGLGVRGDGSLARYDDPSFITVDRAVLRASDAIREASGWTHEEALRLDGAIAEAKIIILAMRAVLRHLYVVASDKVYIRMTKSRIDAYSVMNPEWFTRFFSVIKLDVPERLRLIQSAFERVRVRCASDAVIFVLGANQKKQVNPFELMASISYNDFCRRFCHDNPGKFHFVDANQIVTEDNLADPDHFKRLGYHQLARHILGVVADRFGTKKHA